MISRKYMRTLDAKLHRDIADATSSVDMGSPRGAATARAFVEQVLDEYRLLFPQHGFHVEWADDFTCNVTVGYSEPIEEIEVSFFSTHENVLTLEG